MNGSSSAPRVLERFTWFEVESDEPDAEVDVLLKRLDKNWLALLEASGQRKQDLIEIFLQLGRRPKAVFDNGVSKATVFLTDGAFCERLHIDRFIESLGWRERLKTSNIKSACFPTTLHRISLITKGDGDDVSVIGLNARIGRSVTNVTMQMCPWLINSRNFNVAPGRPLVSLTGKSVLFIGRPGAGKTTLLREMAHALSRVSRDNGTEKTVVVVDKINEIAGDFEVPHACIGEARWMPCGSPELHPQVMREAVENAAPDVILVDEICTSAEVDSACKISARGVSLVATVHGNTLVDTLNCPIRQALLGGMQSIAGVDMKAMQPESRLPKGSLQRASAPAFDVAIELHQKDRWILHPNVRYAVDSHLRGESIEAVELRPGLAIATLGIPVEDGLNYCYECTTSRRCLAHQPSRAPSPAPSFGALGRLHSSAGLVKEEGTPAKDDAITPRSTGVPTPRSAQQSSAINRPTKAGARSVSPAPGRAQGSVRPPFDQGRNSGPSPERDQYSFSPNRGTNFDREQGYSSARSWAPDEYERGGYSLMSGAYKDSSTPKKRSVMR